MTTNASGKYLKIVTAAIAVVMIVSFSLAIYTSTPSVSSSGSGNTPFISYSQPVRMQCMEQMSKRFPMRTGC